MFLSISRARRRWSPAPVVAVVALLLPLVAPAAWAASGAEPTPGSSQGGSPGPSAPAGYRISTELPGRISVDKKSGNTSLMATVRNAGPKDAPDVRLKVVGFKGMRIRSVEGCSAIAAGELPEGSNSGYTCAVGKLAAGASRSYRVSASFDLKDQGQICLPVTLGDTKTLLWQQGPVHFGTTDTSSDAPDTPLLLGQKNVPNGAAASSPASPPAASPSRTPAPSPTSPASPAPSASPSKGGGSAPAPGGSQSPTSGGSYGADDGELAHTGGSAAGLGVLAAAAVALLAAGCGIFWLTARRAGRH
ncbi:MULTISPECIES: hypothetical protein [Streptomyces]|uniref:LPXTG cell wall anchor domain-containing protein n=1 Tax=Streptomyces luteosporeus TaxID=173856 RepID=A0ABN3TNC4_9ACTN